VPSGRTHDGLTWGAAFPLAFGLGWSTESWLTAGIFGAGFLFGGLMFGPDLDLPSVQVRRWGPLRGIWTPYQRMFRHRSGWTHGLFLGPIVRILYLGLWLAAASAGFWALGRGLGWLDADWQRWAERGVLAVAGVDPTWIGYGLLGVWGGSALHTMADTIVSRAKRLLRFRKPRR
jgi:uncharacterized metal-binding protein